ncbi:feruloyl esterase [Embleya sp. NBC_00888]|uniref:alpha/beta hydrolase family esterase n=1 Tax=Embleya sp. NBC_00888 TaxID=2975960 RepID=UPI003866AB78|nr:feruloyl esterase [Embleya sp. NBC_00888]
MAVAGFRCTGLRVCRVLAVFAAVAAVLAVFALARLTARQDGPAAATGSAAADTGCDGRDRQGWVAVPVSFSGETYRVQAYVPRSYDGARPRPLVLNLHGSNSTGAAQMAITGLGASAERYGFVVAIPEGGLSYPGTTGGRAWNIPGVPLYGGHPAAVGGRDEVGFVGATLDALDRSLCLDDRRVYATGFSGGARMTSLLACTLSRRIAAVAPVAGLRADGTDGARPAPCRPMRPVPVLTFHGLADQANPYDGGRASRWTYSVTEAARRWAAVDDCPSTAVRTRVSRHVERTAYTGCAGGAAVILYTQSDAGHTWPGAAGTEVRGFGRINQEISANELMWAFFSEHTL